MMRTESINYKVTKSMRKDLMEMAEKHAADRTMEMGREEPYKPPLIVTGKPCPSTS